MLGVNCGTFEIRGAGPDKAPEPDKPGPYAVGVTTLRLTDPDRPDEQTKEARPMVIEIWYPAKDSTHSSPTDKYEFEQDAPPAAKEKYQREQMQLPAIVQNAHRDAEPLRNEGPYPLILFSHGSGGFRFQSVFYTTHLASHGYVVASIDHEGDNLYYLFLNTGIAENITRLFGSAQVRPLDMLFLYSEIQKRNNSQNDRLYQLIDTSRIGLSGHSLGGLTILMLAQHIKDIRAIVTHVAASSLALNIGLKPEHLQNIPLMIMGSKKDLNLTYSTESKEFYDRLSKPPYDNASRYLISLERGGHYTYSDVCVFDVRKYAKRLGLVEGEIIYNDGCAEHNTPTAEAHRIINYYATAFLNLALRNSTNSKQYLKPIDSPEVSIESHK
jgi:predicted dienelactone hydrolase